MSFDFRADQTRTGRIISSGSSPLLVYPSSSASDLAGGLTGFSTASIGTDVFLYVSGSNSKRSVFGGDVRVSGSLTASIHTVDGTTPFLVGSGITVNYNSSKQYELTGSSITIGGSDGAVQFNENSSLSGTGSFTYTSGALGVQTVSGTNPSLTGVQMLGASVGLGISSSVEMSDGFILFNGVETDSGIGGAVMTNGASINFFSGAMNGSPGFALQPGEEQDTADVSIYGILSLTSGSFSVDSPIGRAVAIYSGSLADPGPSLEILPAVAAGELSVTLTGALAASRITAPEITGSLRTINGTNPFLVGSGTTINYNSLGQYEITGSSGASQPTTLAAQQRADAMRRLSPLATLGPSAGVGWAAPSGTALASVPAFTRSMSGVAVVYSTAAGGHAGGYLVVASTGGLRGGFLSIGGSDLGISASGGGGSAALAGVVAATGWHAVAWSISADGATVRYSVDGGAAADAVITGGPLTFTPRLAADPVWVVAAATAGGSVIPLAYSALWTSILSDADLALLSTSPSDGAPDLTLISGAAPSWEWASAPCAGIDRIIIAGDIYERTGAPLVWMP